MATPHDEEAPASSCGAIPAESARPQSSGGGDGAPQQALQQPHPAAGEGEGAPTPIATAPSAPAVDSPALRAAVAAVAEPPQNQNHLHITHEDYDWMGVLDTLEAHPDGCWGGAYHYHQCSSPRSSPVGHGQGHALQPQHPHPHQQGTTEVQAAHLAASVAAIANNGEEAGKFAAAASNSPVESEAGNCNHGNGSNTEARKQSRIEKKRHREKQRRLDTNAQFEALAEMVREIEAVDFAEEARCSLSCGGGGAGAAIMGRATLTAHVHGAAVSGGPGAPAPPTLEGKSPEESPAEPRKRKAGDDPHLPPPPPTAAFNPSNRVDLIARTISQLSRFRALRRRRRDELVEARRRECQLRKEADELRRTVAHYKAVGLGGMGGTYPQKPPEKVMMMVPMMVPQDAVGRISSGYPAAHQYASCGPGAAAASPWMPTMASPHPSMGGAPYQQPAYGLGAAAHPSHPPAAAASAHLQPYSGNPSTAAPPAGESAMAGQQLQPLPPPGAHGPPPAPSYASAAPHHLAGMHAPPHATAPPAAMAMYPHPPSVPGGMPTVAFGRHPHPLAAQLAPAVPHPGMHAPPPLHGAVNPAGVPPALPPGMHPPQQLQQQPPPAGAMPQQLPADKPPAAPSGGGGNLAHCA